MRSFLFSNFFILSGSQKFGEFSSEGQGFESFEIGELSSSGLSCIRSAKSAFVEALLNVLFSNDLSKFA